MDTSLVKFRNRGGKDITDARKPRSYGVGDGLGVTDAVADPDAPADPEADADTLGTGVVIGVGLGLGDGKSLVGTLANERAKMSTKMTTTPITHACARLSVRGGSAPRYPGAGGSPPAFDPPARR
jgi:hypothetical protein